MKYTLLLGLMFYSIIPAQAESLKNEAGENYIGFNEKDLKHHQETLFLRRKPYKKDHIIYEIEENKHNQSYSTITPYLKEDHFFYEDQIISNKITAENTLYLNPEKNLEEWQCQNPTGCKTNYQEDYPEAIAIRKIKIIPYIESSLKAKILRVQIILENDKKEQETYNTQILENYNILIPEKHYIIKIAYWQEHLVYDPSYSLLSH